MQQVDRRARPERSPRVERPQLARLLIGAERVQFHFRRIQHTAVPRFAQLQTDAAVAQRLHPQIRIVLFTAAMLHCQLHRQLQRPTVSLGP